MIPPPTMTTLAWLGSCFTDISHVLFTVAISVGQIIQTFVPSSIMNETVVSEIVLNRLADTLRALTPEAQKAARYVLENPRDVGVSTVREIAKAADVNPNTMVRMARQVGFEGYEDFRQPFREAIRSGADSFPGPGPVASGNRQIGEAR